MRRSIVAALLALVAPATAAQDRSPGFTIVSLDASSYQVGDARVQSLDAVITRLRAMPELEAVGLQAVSGVPRERVDALIEAIRQAGLKLRIAVVDNEIFTPSSGQ